MTDENTSRATKVSLRVSVIKGHLENPLRSLRAIVNINNIYIITIDDIFSPENLNDP